MSRNVLDCFADKLMESGDAVGSTLSRAGFRIFRNKRRDGILDAAVKETDSVKILVAAQLFQP